MRKTVAPPGGVVGVVYFGKSRPESDGSPVYGINVNVSVDILLT